MENTAKVEACLFMSMELSLKQWKLGFSDGKSRRVRVVGIRAKAFDELREQIGKARKCFGLGANGPVRSCYEAGREGFWIHRILIEKGIDNVVVDASSIEVSRRNRRAKTDRMDAEKLVEQLIRYAGGETRVWSVVRVPSKEAEDARQLHREMEILKKELKAHQSRIRSILFTQGIDVKLKAKFLQQLEQLRCGDGQALAEEIQQRLVREYHRFQLAQADLRTLEKQQRQQLEHPRTVAQEKIVLLKKLCGIAITSSWTFVMEFLGWRKFNNRRELAAAMGIVPMPYQSGQMNRSQGISRSGNRRVRSMIVEIAWSWLRFQPESELSRWYQDRFGHAGARQRRIGIVALARRLMIALWRYLETGVIPEGARLKAN